MEELQNSLELLFSASSKTLSAPSSSMSACTSSLLPLGYDGSEYGALSEMMVSVAKTPSETFNSVTGQVAHDEPNARHKNLQIILGNHGCLYHLVWLIWHLHRHKEQILRIVRYMQKKTC